ncbi:MAG: ABC transporter permease [Promethearchaeota archaeon]
MNFFSPKHLVHSFLVIFCLFSAFLAISACALNPNNPKHVLTVNNQTSSINLHVIDTFGNSVQNASVWLYGEENIDSAQGQYQLAAYPTETGRYGNVSIPIILKQSQYLLISRVHINESVVNFGAVRIISNQSSELFITLILHSYSEIRISGTFWLIEKPQRDFEGFQLSVVPESSIDLPIFGKPLEGTEFEGVVYLPQEIDYTLHITAFTANDVSPWTIINLNSSKIISFIKLGNMSISEISIQQNLGFIWSEIGLTNHEIKKLQQLGFYTITYETTMNEVRQLYNEAEVKYRDSNYSISHYYLREAYLKLKNVKDSLSYVTNVSKNSILILWGIMGVFSLILGWFFSEKFPRLLAIYLITHACLAIFLFIFFPAMKSVNPNELIFFPLVTIFIIPISYQLFNWLSKEDQTEDPQILSTFIASFSLAKRNLKRRKFRSILTASSIVIMIFGFIALTSFGSHSQVIFQSIPRIHGSPSSDGLLIRSANYSKGYISTSTPFDDLSHNEFDIEPPEGFEILTISERWENYPVWGNYGQGSLLNENNVFNISGILGFSFTKENTFTNFTQMLTEGRLPSSSDEALLPSYLKQKGLLINSSVLITSITPKATFGVRISGFYDEEKYATAIDLDGYFMRPQYLSISQSGPVASAADPNHLIFITAEKAKLLNSVHLNRINIKLVQSSLIDYRFLGTYFAVSIGFEAWISHEGTIKRAYYGESLIVEGIEPIVIIMVVTSLTIANVMYRRIIERRKEIYTSNAIGLNPAHITFIFFGESLVLGLIAGVIGYILGVSSYTLFIFFNLNLTVIPKIEVSWSIFAIIFAVIVSIVSSVLPSYSAAKSVSSMHVRKWSKDKKMSPVMEEGSYSFLIPIRIHESQVKDFLEFIERIFSSNTSPRMTFHTQEVLKKEKDIPDAYDLTICFNLRVSQKGHSRAFPMDCELFLTRTSSRFFEPHVISNYPSSFGNPPKGYDKLVELVISHIRKQILVWDANQHMLK